MHICIRACMNTCAYTLQETRHYEVLIDEPPFVGTVANTAATATSIAPARVSNRSGLLRNAFIPGIVILANVYSHERLTHTYCTCTNENVHMYKHCTYTLSYKSTHARVFTTLKARLARLLGRGGSSADDVWLVRELRPMQTNATRGFFSTHHRHLAIHQNDIKHFRCYARNGLYAVTSCKYARRLVAQLLQHMTRNFPIEDVVVHDQHATVACGGYGAVLTRGMFVNHQHGFLCGKKKRIRKYYWYTQTSGNTVTSAIWINYHSSHLFTHPHMHHTCIAHAHTTYQLVRPWSNGEASRWAVSSEWAFEETRP